MKNKYLLDFREALSALYSKARISHLYDLNLFSTYPSKYHRSNQISRFFVDILKQFYDYDSSNVDTNKQGFAQFSFFEWDSDSSKYVLTSYGKEIVDGVFRQYGDFYCTNSEDLTEEKVIPQAVLVLDDFMNVLNMTYSKYSNILAIYDAKTQDLLNKVESTEVANNANEGKIVSRGSSSGSGSSVNKYKDTPQSAVNVVNDDNYNSNVEVATDSNETSSQDSSTTTFEEHRGITRSDDRDTLMARIDEIQQSYQKVLERWIKEFNPLFWEEL